MSSESPETGGTAPEEEPMGTSPVETSEPTEHIETEPQEAGAEAPAATARTEGRRAQLRRVSDSLQILSTEVGRFRKSHEAGAKSLEAQVTSLRKEFAAHIRSKGSGAHARAHEADTKRLEKQIALLRSDVASLKAQLAKEGAKSRAREEAALSKIIAKVKGPRPAKKPQAKTSRSRRR